MTQPTIDRAITVTHLKDWIDGGRNIIVIDPFPAERHSRVHLPGARNACVYEVTFLDQIREITADKDREIAIYGASGETWEARMAAEKLERAGYRRVHVLDGGLDAWRRAGLPLTGLAADEPEEPDPALPADKFYRVDIENSFLEWTGRNPFHAHHGTLKLADGGFTVKNGRGSGKFRVDLKSLKNLDIEDEALKPVLIAHLLSDDFFFFDKFPDVTFTLDSAEPLSGALSGGPNYLVNGTLLLRGVSAPLSFDCTAKNLEGGILSLEAHFDFDRTAWGAVYGCGRLFRHLMQHLVYDPVSIGLFILAR